MTIAKNEDGHTFNRFEDEIERFFSNWHSPLAVHSGHRKYPPVNLEVSSEHYDYYVFAAGLDRDKLDITVDHNLLKISGVKLSCVPSGDTVTPFRKERSSGTFTRALNLPQDCDADNIVATYRSGILHLRALRGSKQGATKISVK